MENNELNTQKENNVKSSNNSEKENNKIDNGLIDKAKKKNNEINELKHQIFELENYIYNYNKKEKEYEKIINNNDNLIKQFQNQNKELFNNKKILDENLIEKERIQHLYEYNTKLLEKLKDENNDLKINLDYSISKVNELKKTLSEIEESNKNNQKEVDELNYKLDKKIFEKSKKKDSENINGIVLTEKENEVDNLQYEILGLKEKLEEFEYKILVADRDFRQVKIDIEDLKRKNRLEVEIFEEKIGLLKNDIENLNKRILEYKKGDNKKIIRKRIKNLEEEIKDNLEIYNEKIDDNHKLIIENKKKQLINLRLQRDFMNLKEGNINKVLSDRQKDKIKDEKILREIFLSSD